MRIWILISAILPLLAGCAWFEEKANPPLEGDRTAVLQRADKTAAENVGTPALDAVQTVNAWSMTNANSAQSGVNANISPRLEKMWGRSIGDASADRKQLTARPVAADGKIFAMDNNGNVTAIDAQTGEQIFNVRTRADRSSALAGGLAVDQGVLYVTSGLPEILAISTANGGKIWQVELDAPARSAPVVANGKVFVVTRGSQSFALDAVSGKILWQHRGLIENAGVLSGGAPAADDEMVLIPYASGEVVAIVGGNGSVLWGETLASGRPDNNLATLHDLRAPPMILADVVVAANYSANITGIEKRSGERIWAHNFGAMQPMAASGNAVFLITTNAQLVALNRKTGEIFWSKPLQTSEREADEPQEYWYGPLLLNGQLLLLSADGRGELRDAATGEVVKTFEGLEEPAENPIVLNDMIYWPTASGEVVAYR